MISSIHNTNSISEQPKTLSPHLDYVVHSNVSLFLPQQVVYKILQLGIGELECVAAIVIPEDKVVDESPLRSSRISCLLDLIPAGGYCLYLNQSNA